MHPLRTDPVFAAAVSDLSRLSDSPEVELRHLIEEAGKSGKSKAAQMRELQSLLKARLEGKPLQYVLGHWNFRQLSLDLDERVLIPRPETEMTVGYGMQCLQQIKKPEISVLDLGCGSGAIGLSILLETGGDYDLDLVCTDISRAALKAARQNFKKHGCLNKKTAFLQGDWFKALKGKRNQARKFHLIISNPPYVGEDEKLPEEVASYEPAMALFGGPTGFEAPSSVIGQASKWLQPSGWLVVEMAPSHTDKAKDLAASMGFINISVKRDLAGRNRVLICQQST